MLCIALFDLRTSIIHLAHADLSAVDSILAVEDIRAGHTHGGGVDVLNHVFVDLVIVVHQSKSVRHVFSIVDLLLLVGVDSLLDFIDFLLYVVERPLLRLLHLNHHLLNLFELLKAVCLHLLKLLLFRDQHLQPSIIIKPKERMFHLLTHWLLHLPHVVNPVGVVVRLLLLASSCSRADVVGW